MNKYLAVLMITSTTLVSFSSLAYDDAGRYDDYDSYQGPMSDGYEHNGAAFNRMNSGDLIRIDLGRQTWSAYNSQGGVIRSGHVSGGKNYCPDIHRGCRTVTGTFTIYNKKGAGCVSSRFPVGRGGAHMPYCMFFHGGYALHGSNEVPNYNASHGCVRMSPADAQWLNMNYVNVGRTRVNIHY